MINVKLIIAAVLAASPWRARAGYFRQSCFPGAAILGCLSLLFSAGFVGLVQAQPTIVEPNLAVRTVANGLIQPTSMAFLGASDILVLEKASGKVKRVINGVVQGADALDLAVNSASERGLLGIALHPSFPLNPGVYLYWTESST